MTNSRFLNTLIVVVGVFALLAAVSLLLLGIGNG